MTQTDGFNSISTALELQPLCLEAEPSICLKASITQSNNMSESKVSLLKFLTVIQEITVLQQR